MFSYKIIMIRGTQNKVIKVKTAGIPEALQDSERLKFLLAGKELWSADLSIKPNMFEYTIFHNDPDNDPKCCLTLSLSKTGNLFYATLFNDEWNNYELKLGRTLVLCSEDFWSLARLVSFNIELIISES